MLYGPNTNGVNSILFMHEAQAHLIVRALRTLRHWRLGSLDVRPRVMRRYNERVQAAMQGKVWVAGCTNYFATSTGRVVTQLPYSAGEYWLRTRFLGPWRYRFSRRGRSAV
jgi:cyclohexanone monooxygenase